MLRPAALLLLLLLPACARDRVDLPARRAALEAGLADGRRAHFATDARLLAAGLDDTLESLDAGARGAQPRDSVRAMFARYFAGAAYRAWENLEPPRITLSDDGSLAAVLQVVCVDREESDGQGERRRRVFVTAYSSSYHWRDGGWRMQTRSSGVSCQPFNRGSSRAKTQFASPSRC